MHIRKSIQYGAFAVAGMTLFCGCNDAWDDHFQGAPDVTFQGTTMEALLQNDNTKNFAAVLKATGADETLGADQMFTVWAPTITDGERDSLLALVKAGKKEDVVNRFVNNHISRFAYSFNNADQNIRMLNKKYQVMTADGTIQNRELLKSNIVTNNGVMHVVDGAIEFRNSLFEQIAADYEAFMAQNPGLVPSQTFEQTRATGKTDYPSLYGFLMEYDKQELDIEKSVQKGINENGEIEYADSVTKHTNDVLDKMQALIYSEDSTYMMIMPSMEEYKNRYNEVMTYLEYPASMNSETNPNYVDSLKHFYASRLTMADLFYNTRAWANESMVDSVKSTQYFTEPDIDFKNHVYYKPYEADGILSGLETDFCSNGEMMRADAFPLTLEQQFLKDVKPDATKDNYFNDETGFESGVASRTVETRTIVMGIGDNVTVRWRRFSPATANTNIQYTFRVPNTFSGVYDMYLVTVPYQWNQTGLLARDERGYRFHIQTYMRDPETGLYPAAGTDYKINLEDFDESYNLNPENYTNAARYTNYTTNVLGEDGEIKLKDTLLLGRVDMKECYYKSQENGYSEGLLVKIINNRPLTSADQAKYSTEHLVVGLILKPYTKKED